MDDRWSNWTSARDRTIRLEELAKHYESLGKLGLAPSQEQRIASRLTQRHLSGPSAAIEVNRRLEKAGSEEICWLESGDVKKVGRATLMRIRRGLRESRQDTAYWRAKYLSSKNGEEKVAADRRIQAISAKVRRQVRNDLNDKKERIVKEQRDCGKHQLCQWMRKKTENRSKRTDKEEPETEDDRVRREMRELIEEAIEIDESN